MKKVKNNIIKKVKKLWNKEPVSILVPILSIIIFIVSTFTIGIIKGFLLLIAINILYFGINYIYTKMSKKKKNLKKENSSNERIEKKSNIKQKKKRKKKWKIVLLIFLIFFIIGIIGIIAFCVYIVINAPKFDEKLLYVSDPTIVLSSDGTEIGKLGTEKRITITYDEIPEVLIDAIVATEDSRFFEHNGVDWARFLKASFYQLLGKSEAGGASTLTMQVSKRAFTSTEDEGIEGIIRKFTDVYVSMFEIEKNYTKEQIMEFYVNSQYLGKNAYGVEQVSLNYFGKSTKELNLAEAAMIAGLFQAPGRYDPYDNPEATEKRRQNVLKLMLRHNYITEEEYEVAKKMTVDKIVIPKENNNAGMGVSPYQSFIDTVAEEVQKKTGKNPYTTPMIIYTTLNTDLQDYINNIMNGTSYNWENDKVQAGIAVINVKDGSVAALGGNRNVNAIDTFNYATDIENQIGSTAKPLYDYGPAIQYNNWSTYQILVDEPITYSDGTPINNWNGAYEGFETMRTALNGSRNIPALKAFKTNDKAKVIEFVEKLGLTPEIYSCPDGYEREKKNCIKYEDGKVIENIAATKSNSLHEAHAIGGYNGESPLSMAAAYSAFANGGIYTEPYTFTKLIYQETKEEFINDINQTEAMSEETAYMISDMLTTTAPQAMGRYYNINGIKYAAKTGTTNYDEETLKQYNLLWSGAVNDLWTIGFNTEYAIGVWYGYNSLKELKDGYYNVLSSGQHERLFQAVGQKVFTNKDNFTKPSGVVSVSLESECPEPTLPSEFTPSNLIQTELFIKGTEPTTVSTRFAKLSDVSNLKSTTTNNKIKITWNAVNNPEINTENYLKKYFSKVFVNSSYLNSYVASRLAYNNSNIGTLGYNIYKQNSDGSLTLLDFVTSNAYETTVNKSGTYTFVIKTAYSIFKNNMSDGKTIKINITVKNNTTPDTDNDNNENDDKKDENDDNSESDDNNNNNQDTDNSSQNNR